VEVYQPLSGSVPAQVLPNPDHVRVLDQGAEGSAVGHGMASMINYLLRERGIRDQVSARMLQQLSKQVGGAPLDVDQGSQLGDGMRGWSTRRLLESQWPYRAHQWGERPGAGRDAQKYKPPATGRAQGRSCHAGCACRVQGHSGAATVHEGWMSQPVKTTIPFTGKDQDIGGHAFAVLGYTEQRFIIQNSWSGD
jgi:hypothetical protein